MSPWELAFAWVNSKEALSILYLGYSSSSCLSHTKKSTFATPALHFQSFEAPLLSNASLRWSNYFPGNSSHPKSLKFCRLDFNRIAYWWSWIVQQNLNLFWKYSASHLVWQGFHPILTHPWCFSKLSRTSHSSASQPLQSSPLSFPW